MKRNLLVGAFALLITGSAMADAINAFTFHVRSSDDKMYACNVGVRHIDGREGHVVGARNSGLTKTTHDYINGYSQILNSDMVRGASQHYKLEAANDGSWTKLFGPKEAFAHRVSNALFKFSSENYGVEYFVDICYRGPQISFYPYAQPDFKLTKNQLVYTKHWSFGSGPVGANNTTDGFVINDTELTYLEQAGIEVKSTTVCDMQLGGVSTGSGNGLELDSRGDLIIEDMFGSNPDSIVESNNGAWEALTSSSSTKRWAGPYIYGQPDYVGPSLNQGGGSGYTNQFNAPKYCVTRYTIRETESGPRDWRVLGGQFIVDTEISNVGELLPNNLTTVLP